MLFRVALALLKLHEPLLLAQDNPGELLRAARRVAAEAHDRDALMKVGWKRFGLGWRKEGRAARCSSFCKFVRAEGSVVVVGGCVVHGLLPA